MHIHKAAGAVVLMAELDWQYGQWHSALTYRQEIRDWLAGYGALGLLRLAATVFFGRMYNDLGLLELARQELEAFLPVARRSAELQTVIPNLGELARTYAAIGRIAETAELIVEINRWLDEAEYLDVCTPEYLLFICQWLAQARPADLNQARTALQRMEKAHIQIKTPISVVYLSEGQGYVVLAEGDSAAVTFHPLSSEAPPGFSNSVWDIIEDRTGHLWLAASSALFKFDPNTEQFRRYTPADGPGEIRALYEDDAGYIWFDGLTLHKLDPATENITTYQSPLGPVPIVQALVDRNQQMWLATLVGLFRFDLQVCAACKKIQNTEGAWHQAKLHCQAHSQADFSHGFCPACIIELYPDLYQAVLDRRAEITNVLATVGYGGALLVSGEASRTVALLPGSPAIAAGDSASARRRILRFGQAVCVW